MPKPQILVVGIDGGTFNLIDPWIRRGCLPNIGGLLRDGVRGVLRSTLTPNTCPAWKSFSTGKNPGRLGIFNWRNKLYGSYGARLVEPGTIGARDLWDIVGAVGRTVAVVGVPMTYPPRPVNGVMLTGMLTPPGAGFAYPRELGREIEEKIGEYRLDPAVLSTPTEEELFEEQNAITINRFRVLRYLLRRDGGSCPYDLVVAVFTAPDRLQHLFWPPSGSTDHVVLKAYQQIDGVIAQLRGLVDRDTTIVLMSDHGFTHLDRFIHANQVLSDMGLLAATNQGSRMLQRLGVTRQSVGRLARTLGLNRLRASVPDAAKKIIPFGQFGLDMTRTKAYSWSGGEVFVNLRGREPNGIIQPGEEYNSLCNQIIDRFEHLADGNRRPNIRVFRREEVFSGRHLHEAPDMMIEVREPGYGLANRHTGMEISEILPGQVFSDNTKPGGRHDADGIFAAFGPDIQQHTVIENAEIIDLAPTVLHAMGLPIPDDVDGKVLPIFRTGSPTAVRPVERTTPEEKEREEVLLSEAERQRLEAVLKGFGYLG